MVTKLCQIEPEYKVRDTHDTAAQREHLSRPDYSAGDREK